MKLLFASDVQTTNDVLLAPSNDVDVLTLELQGVTCIELHFPKFSDGRAFSQAVQLRRRQGYTGVLRATGDVLLDQLLQMRRCGFAEAVLRADQNRAHGEHLLRHYDAFYQGDAAQPQPRFAALPSA